ncbi:MAG: ImmA/IrrE family metallo-endopeptidase [Caldilineaceae bacterium SB0664_bin_22]|nr:ImmA/IrrE family metallo-endopeptidase [Caldilineaceae bacterium SB0664_bin_22]MYC64144.1 ImmA/IrrE family metallo-endopeptidase [Caldilineaceae bacterium SB0661_bin_34]
MATRTRTNEEPITGEVLAWAIDESGFSASDLAERLKVSPDSIEAWTSESASPTVGQLTRLADVLKRPRALFFAPHPPKDRIASEYRHVNTDEGRRGLGSEELLTIRRAKRVQSIVKQIRADSGVSVEPVPIHTLDEPPEVVGRELRDWISLGQPDRHLSFTEWRAVFAARQILVLVLSVRFGTSPNAGPTRPSIRGFALLDPLAPAITVISSEIQVARSFTLFHELAHLSLGKVHACGPPVFNADKPDRTNHVSMETWCDRVAEHALMPTPELKRVVGARKPDLALVETVGRHFKVSRRAAAVALIHRSLAAPALYDEVEARWPLLDGDKPKGGGGKPRSRARIRVDEWGHSAVETVLNAFEHRTVSEAKVRRWLKLSGPELDEARSHLEIVP